MKRIIFFIGLLLSTLNCRASVSWSNGNTCEIHTLTIHNWGWDIWPDAGEDYWDTYFDVDVYPANYVSYTDYHFEQSSGRSYGDFYELVAVSYQLDPAGFYPFDEPDSEWSYGNWSPNESTVCSSQSVNQTRSKTRQRRAGERNQCNDEINVYYYTENDTDGRTVQGTASLSSITGPSLVCPDLSSGLQGCSAAVGYSVTISPAQSGIPIQWNGGNAGSVTVPTDANGVSTYSTTFPNTGSTTISAAMSGGTCGVNLSVTIASLAAAPSGTFHGVQWGEFKRTGEKAIRMKTQSQNCNQPLGATELGAFAFTDVACNCSSGGGRHIVIAAMEFAVGDYWYGSDVIQYRNLSSDVTRVINAEGDHYNSYAPHATAASGHWNAIRNTVYTSESAAQAARANLHSQLLAARTAFVNYNTALDAYEHPQLGNEIKANYCP